ncbi:MAG TPA: glycosyltransferase family 39 protein, partial [Caldilineaceae bacterium]|nr:glycosyltransferase family 39 protein [Caldilineaceae bacterium]
MPDRAATWLCALLLLLAFGLRACHLDYQSLWSDEGISLVRSALPLGEMLAQMPVEHVPGYFVLLKGWIALTGETDFGVRYFSLLPSVWAVALLYRLAVDLGSRQIGLLAAALLATNGFQVWYAQEARMYSWLLAAGLLSTLCFWRLLADEAGKFPWGVWTGYVLATTATIYLHYFGFLVPLSHTAFAALWWLLGRERRPLRRWVGAGVTVALLFSPWMVRGWRLLAFEGWRPPLDPAQAPWLLLRAYSVGETMPTPWMDWLPWVYLVLAALGIAAWARRGQAALFLAALLGTALGVIMLLVVRQPDFHVRYPIFISVPLLLLAAGGVAGLSPRWWRPDRSLHHVDLAAPTLVLALLLAANALALERLYTDTTLHKPDFRSAAQTISAGAGPEDVVLVDGPNPELVFNHY